MFDRVRLRKLIAKALLLAVSGSLFTANAGADQAPIIWFCPTLPSVQPDGRLTGSVDFDMLFQTDAMWSTVSGKISVFKTYQSYVTRRSIADLSKMFLYLKERGIAFALEFGPMNRDPGGCGAGVEGFAAGGEKSGLALAEKIKTAGGVLEFVAMDEPFWFGNLTSSPGACHLSPGEMADNAFRTVKAVRAVFPNVKFGDVEPVRSLSGVDLVGRYREWANAWRDKVGVPLAFFHADVLWKDDPNKRLDSLEGMFETEGVPFGIIYNGDQQDQTDAQWFAHARERIAGQEGGSHKRPQQAVFQSWNWYPSHALPEDDLNSHSGLVKYYLSKFGSAR